MRSDVYDLQRFYESRHGQLVRRLVGRQIRAVWPDMRGYSVLGLGYATPYLSQLEDAKDTALGIMPATQGAQCWPRGGANRIALARQAELPLEDRSFDRILAVHALETSQYPRQHLRELWRILADGGRLLAVVPNRRGLWSLSEGTPFGHGQPYSLTQLERLLGDNLFTPLEHARALYTPPSPARFWIRTAIAWERAGLRLGLHFSGVLLVEAQKQIHGVGLAAAAVPGKRRRYAPVPDLAGAAARSRAAARDQQA